MKKFAVAVSILGFLLLCFQGCGPAVRKTQFRMGELDYCIEYPDPTTVDVRLRDSRILPFKFDVHNPSDSAVKLNQEDIKLNVGVSSILEPVPLKSVVEEIRRTKKIPAILKVLRVVGSQSSTFYPNFHENLEKELKKHEFKDDYLEPGQRREGIVYYMLPDTAAHLDWASLEFDSGWQQALETKGMGVYIRGEDKEGFWVKLERLWKQYILGEAPPIKNSYALLVGMGAYQHLNPISSPTNDVERVKKFLIEQGFDEILSITDEDVTIAGIKEPQAYFTNKIGKEDRFLFYYSGHGTVDTLAEGEPRGYIPLVDEKCGQFQHSIPMDDLVEWMEQLDAKHLLVVLDCCFSGLAAWGLEAKSGSSDEIPRMDAATWRLAMKPAKYLLMATTESEKSWIVEGRSLFTEAMIKGVISDEAERIQSDGYIGVRELYVWLRPYIASEAKKVKTDMTPLLKDLGEHGVSKGEFFFISEKE